jgi:1-acyl-sn-glycerol-3-phosphate acyltransferase
VQVGGSPPRPPFLLACNHLGYLDVAVLASQAPCVFVAKSEVAGWPVLGPLVRQMGTIFVERGRRADLTRVIDRMEESVTNGAGVTFFPEGTSSDGRDVLPFHASLLEAAARAGYPVFCAGLRYRTGPGDPPSETAVAWWGDTAFAPHFRALLGVRGIEARLRFAPEPVTGSDRKDLAREARERVVQARGPAPEERTR